VSSNSSRSNIAESGWWASEPVSETTRLLALRWVVRLRYGLIAGEIVLIAALTLGIGISIPMLAVSPAIAIQTLSNWFLGLRMRHLGRNAEHIVGTLFILDALCLTLILALSGGPANPFSLLYLVQITFSAVVLRKLWTWALAVVSTLAFGTLFWVSRAVPAFLQHGETQEFSAHLLGMWIAFTTAALLISFFVGKLSTESRKKEREILHMQKRLARNDRLASLVTLAAGAAHEIATPLSTIAVTAKEMEHEASLRLHDRRMEEDSRLIRSQVERCRLILERMGAQGADPFGEAPESTDLHQLLRQVKDRFPDDEKRIQIQIDGAETLNWVLPVRAAIESLSALVKNALDASSGGGTVLLRAVQAGPERMRFLIRDEGTGMNAEVLERVAEPFFTTKSPGKGMGLGAFLAHLFAQTLGGQLSFESEPGRGCTAILELPDMKHARS
jgi:two-component system, sensor histidine kinase RegB